MDKSPHESALVQVNGIHLHYLDWRGRGDTLLFLAGMGCSVHIFDEFAPRFTDQFHVLAMDRRGHGDSDYPETGYDPDTLTEDLRQFLDALGIDKVILVGHSMARVELANFARLYPERLLKLVFLDAAYDTASETDKAVRGKNPLPKIIPEWPQNDPNTMDDFVATVKRLYPALAVIWGEVMEEQTKHEVKVSPEGKVVDRMSDAITKALDETLTSYSPEYSSIQAPTLSFFALLDGSDYLSFDYMSEAQRSQVLDFCQTVLQPHQKQYIKQFQSKVPHARIVEIPNGHHYCFIKQQELVYEEMRKFLLE